MADRQGAPAYKFTQIPKEAIFDASAAFYGAEKQRTRRNAKLGQAQTQLETGQIDLGNFNDQASRILGMAVGLPERQNIADKQVAGTQLSTDRTYAELQQKYDSGQITYDQMLAGLREAGSRFNLSTTSFQRKYTSNVADLNPDEVRIGPNQIAVKDIITGITDKLHTDNQFRKKTEYDAGQISFQEYADFLSGELNYYVDGTSQDADLQGVFKSAYQTELGRYYTQVKGAYDAGTISDEEWAQFNNWYSGKLSAGPQMTNSIGTFTPTPTPVVPAPAISTDTPASQAPKKKGKAKPKVKPTSNLNKVSTKDLINRKKGAQSNLAAAKKVGDKKAIKKYTDKIKAIDKNLSGRKK